MQREECDIASRDTRTSYSHARALATAASSSFFCHLLDLIGSLKEHYPQAPDLLVYDIGLAYWQKWLLGQIEKVKIVPVPPFVPHWRCCYTWKLYILKHIPARLVYYLDASSRVLRPLDPVFEEIGKEGCFCVGQQSFGYSMADIIPSELSMKLQILNPSDLKEKDYFAAGSFGFARGTPFERAIEEAYALACDGWTLGWSPAEKNRNRRKDYTTTIRTCPVFRHDQSVLNAVVYARGLKYRLQAEADFCAMARGVGKMPWIVNGRSGSDRGCHVQNIRVSGAAGVTNQCASAVLVLLRAYQFLRHRI